MPSHAIPRCPGTLFIAVVLRSNLAVSSGRCLQVTAGQVKAGQGEVSEWCLAQVGRRRASGVRFAAGVGAGDKERPGGVALLYSTFF